MERIYLSPPDVGELEECYVGRTSTCANTTATMPTMLDATLDSWAKRSERDREQSRLAARQAFERFAAGQPPNIIELGLRAVARNTGK